MQWHLSWSKVLIYLFEPKMIWSDLAVESRSNYKLMVLASTLVYLLPVLKIVRMHRTGWYDKLIKFLYGIGFWDSSGVTYLLCAPYPKNLPWFRRTYHIQGGIYRSFGLRRTFKYVVLINAHTNGLISLRNPIHLLVSNTIHLHNRISKTTLSVYMYIWYIQKVYIYHVYIHFIHNRHKFHIIFVYIYIYTLFGTFIYSVYI